MIVDDTHRVSPVDIDIILLQHPETTFKVKIDSCFAGRFLTDDLRKRKNLLVLEVSSNSEETSFSALPADIFRRTANNPGYGEFTNANLIGLERFATSRAEVQNTTKLGGSLLAHMLARSFEIGTAGDTARVNGFTHPFVYRNFPKPPEPLPLQVDASHEHPQPNPGFSLTCAKVTSTTGATVTVAVEGPEDFSETKTLKLTEKTGSVSFKIDTAGTYTFDVTATLGTKKAEVEKVYEVPATPPRGAELGPFPCPAP